MECLHSRYEDRIYLYIKPFFFIVSPILQGEKRSKKGTRASSAQSEDRYLSSYEHFSLILLEIDSFPVFPAPPVWHTVGTAYMGCLFVGSSLQPVDAVVD